MNKVICLFVISFSTMCACVIFFEKYNSGPVEIVTSNQIKSAKADNNVEVASQLEDVLEGAVNPLEHKRKIIEEDLLPPPIFITEATTSLSIYLTDFLEQNGIGYMDTSVYPFSNEVGSHITKYLNNQKYIIFDNSNTDLWNALNQRFDNVNPTSIIADFTGVAVVDQDDPGFVIVTSFIDPKTNSLDQMMIEFDIESTPEKTEASLKETLKYLEKQKLIRKGEINDEEI